MQKFKTAKLSDAGGDLSQRWFVFYYFRDPDTNKFVRFRMWISSAILTGSGRREKAHQLIKLINKRLNEGFNPYAIKEKQYTSISVAMDYVKNVKEKSCRLRTTHTYSSMIGQFKSWLIIRKMSNMSLGEFNYSHAQDFMDWTQNELGNANRTYNNRLSAMRTIFKVLVKREWIMFNPFEKIESLPEEDPEIISFTIGELTTMQENLPTWNYDLYAIACLIFYCFIRPQEIVRLRVSNFDLVRRLIVLPGRVSKNKKHEIVHIPDPLMPVLLKLDMNYPSDYFVFSKDHQRGKVEYAPTRISESWREFADKFGIAKNIYSLKHTGVGMAVERGINIRDLQLQLRHYSLDMTQIYLDKFNRRPSESLSKNFPDLGRLTKSSEPVRSPLPAHIYNPGLS